MFMLHVTAAGRGTRSVGPGCVPTRALGKEILIRINSYPLLPASHPIGLFCVIHRLQGLIVLSLTHTLQLMGRKARVTICDVKSLGS